MSTVKTHLNSCDVLLFLSSICNESELFFTSELRVVTYTPFPTWTPGCPAAYTVPYTHPRSPYTVPWLPAAYTVPYTPQGPLSAQQPPP